MLIANFEKASLAVVYDAWQWDYGQKLQITGIDLPEITEVHFSLEESGGSAIRRVATNGIVQIPDDLLAKETDQNYEIHAFIYLTDETSGETVKHAVIIVKSRPKPEEWITQNDPAKSDPLSDAVEAINKKADETVATVKATAESMEQTVKETAEQIQAAFDETVKTVDDIKDEAVAAKDAAEDAADRAEQSAKTAGYVNFNVADNGHLMMTRVNSPFDFRLNGGHLEVLANG